MAVSRKPSRHIRHPAVLMSEEDIIEIDQAPTLERLSHNCFSDATPKSSNNCNQCGINALKLAQLGKKLKEFESNYNSLQTAYENKCNELKDIEIEYEDKCRELTELQESLNGIFFNISNSNNNQNYNNNNNNRFKSIFSTSRSNSTSSLMIHGGGINNIHQRIPSLYNHERQQSNMSITPAPSETLTLSISEAPTSIISHIKKITPNPGVLSKIQSDESKEFEHNYNYNYNKYDNVHSISQCFHIQRIFNYLLQYKKQPIVFEGVYSNKIVNILDDYHHILYEHYNQYQEINGLKPQDLKCNISKCEIMFKEKKK
eukprot:546204_1